MKNWQDTVIEPEDINRNTHNYVTIRTLLEHQAEASFKAGQIEERKRFGKWLEKRERKVACLDGEISRGFNITQRDIEALKQGKLPEGV